MKMSETTRRLLSQRLKAKWRSGTRRLNPSESRTRQGLTLSDGYASGRLKRPVLSPESLRRMAVKLSRTLKGRVTRKTPISDSEKEKRRAMSIAQRGPGHPCEKPWRLRSPDNQVFIFKNLRHFVRTHQHLFEPEDLIKRSYGARSRACAGIYRLSPRSKNQVDRWKNWTWLDNEAY